GLRSAALARAAFPTAEAKARAFESATKEKLSNHIQLSTIRGFQRPSQRDLLVPYVERYFEIILEVWNSETYEMASNIVVGLYPTYVVAQSTLDATEAWLAHIGKDAPGGLRRIVSENRDAMARALKAQAKDAQVKP
ncbi:MAG: ERAP1-like C-terminal domain-containing protein, partial [Actinobacteria bacterium]|nr:ERAP1-like C-terminal domain-containing protein [Actinomycetota bacterium]